MWVPISIVVTKLPLESVSGVQRMIVLILKQILCSKEHILWCEDRKEKIILI